MKKATRALVGLVLVLALAVIGFILGMRIGVACCAPHNAGLAGGAIVLGYGLMGAIAAALAAIPAAVWLPPRWLIGATLVLAVIGGILGGVIVQVYMQSRAQTAEHLRQAYEKMNKFSVTLTHAARSVPFALASFDWGERRYSVTRENQTCRAALTGEQGATMLKALREIEGVVYKDPYPCAGTLGVVTRELDMTISEATGQDSTARLAITAACLERYPQLAAPFIAAKQILDTQGVPQFCE